MASTNPTNATVSAAAPIADTTTTFIKNVLKIDGPAKSLCSEHTRALLRLYGITGLKSEGIENLMYELIFTDPTTSGYLSHLGAGWEDRRKNGIESEEYKAMKAFIAHCCNKGRDQLSKLNQPYPPPG